MIVHVADTSVLVDLERAGLLEEGLPRLIAERYERTATILTSNLHFDECGAAFAANKMIGAATLDRLRHGAYKLVLDGDSYWAIPPESEVSKPPIEKGRKVARSAA